VSAAAHGGPHARAGGHALKEAEAYTEPTQEQAPDRSCSPWRGAHAGTPKASICFLFLFSSLFYPL